MSKQLQVKKFGTGPVFFTAISTILGAVMFLRFGFAVGNVGLIGTIGTTCTLSPIEQLLAVGKVACDRHSHSSGVRFLNENRSLAKSAQT